MLLKDARAGERERQYDQLALVIADLEHAKKQQWEEKQRLSQQIEEERRKNLEKLGILETFVGKLRKENEGLKSRLSLQKSAKSELKSELKSLKDQYVGAKQKLTDDIANYERMVAAGNHPAEDTNKLLEQIKRSKEELRQLRLRQESVRDSYVANFRSKLVLHRGTTPENGIVERAELER